MMSSFSKIITESLAETVVYHFEDDTVILPCHQSSNETIIWQGPKKLSTYGIGKNIDPNLAKFKRLSIIHVNGSQQYNLQIRHFSSEDEGRYKCIRSESSKDEFFTLNIGSKLL